MGSPDTPTPGHVETGRGGGGRSGDGGGRSGGGTGGRRGGGGRGEGSAQGGRGGGDGGGGQEGGRGGGGEGDGDGSRRGFLYTDNESVAIARSWDVVTTDAIVGTDQTDLCFWRKVLVVYNQFKPPGSVDRTPDQIRKKFGRITIALRKFIGIYENQLRTAESGRSEADVKSLSIAICENASDSGPRRPRRSRAGNYSSSSGGSRTFDLNDEVMEEPPSSLSRRPRPLGQQSAIRAARSGSAAASQHSAAGPSASAPGSARATLKNTLEVQMIKELKDTLVLYEKSTDPPTKRMYYDLIVRLRTLLGWGDTATAATGPQSGGGGGDGDGLAVTMQRVKKKWRIPIMTSSSRRWRCFF
ncbi:glycine, alanine and asparagine-rich protein-like [Salvia hispanica]|uniref:glycine, alanine and asparagine-rich protein-like n=1 Tax=Salvia hispanica TaxID=49212 RepID=UPI00200967DC|nr:glycine, alanine and asparagine-rich protein-like [Salvia hispanica]